MDKKIPPPRLRKNLQTGDLALEIWDCNGKRHTIDMGTPVFLHHMPDEYCYIQFGGGTIQTAYDYDQLVDFVYPHIIDDEDFYD